MNLTLLKSKLHRATITGSDLHYVGSITIDEDLMDLAGIIEYEQVHIADIDNGSRFETYVIKGERGSGTICLNGAAARHVSVGDKIIIMCYVGMTPEEAQEHEPVVVILDEGNTVVDVTNEEIHGTIM